jgi:hypothetical protein
MLMMASRALGLTVPLPLRGRADEVIEKCGGRPIAVSVIFDQNAAQAEAASSPNALTLLKL